MNKTGTICLSMLGLGLIAAAPVRHGTAKASAAGPVLWQGVRAGMTEQQLRAVLPGVEKNENNNSFHAPDTLVDYSKMQVAIGFRDQHVWNVMLSGGYPNALLKSLTEKYGAPFSPYRCQALTCQADWKSPTGVKVSLVTMVPSGVDVTTVTYSVSNTSGL